jgi:hypothetical protein
MALTDLLSSMKEKASALFQKKEPAKPNAQDGNAPPQGGLTALQQDLGANYEKLKEKRPHIVAALQQLVLEYRMDGQYSQRLRILRTRYARLFERGIQYALYNAGSGDFDFATMATGLQLPSNAQESSASGQRFQYVTNLYQAYEMSFIALVSQDIPSWIAYPKSRETQEDITAAKVAMDVGDLIERNNDAYEGMQKIAKYLWTDGIVGQYWRYVVDGDRFGYKIMPIQGTREVLVDGQRMTVPSDEGEDKIPNGQEVVTYVGGLEMMISTFADDFYEVPYIQWAREPHRAKLKAAFPHAAKGIEANAGMTSDQVYERISRLGVKMNISFLTPGDALEMLPTFTSTWLRKWAFKRFDDEKLVAELEELYPDGCVVDFAGFEYCQSRSENMNDHWRVLNAFPGDGQNSPSVGDCLVDVQEQYNSLSNIMMENSELGLPPIYADPQVLDFDALANQVSEPAVHYPARARPGQRLEDGFYSPPPAEVSPTISARMQELIGPVAQFLTGLFNAAAGGPMEGVAGKTATGYEIARDQSLGRVGMIYRRMKDFYVEGIGLGIEIFKKNRPEDVEVAFPGEHQEEKAKWIRLADLKGNVMVEPEADESFPRLKSQQRSVLEALITNAATLHPELLKLFDSPENMAYVKNIMGLSELNLPGEDAALLAMRVIQKLLDEEPFQGAPLPQMGPNGQVAMVAPPPQATVQVDPILALNPEFIGAMLEKIVEWAGTDSGRQEARTNLKGYMNVYLYAKQLSDIVQQAQQAAMQQQMMLKHPPPKPPAQPPPKGPSESIAFKDMPPEGQTQMAAQAGITLTPEQMQEHQDQQRQDRANELQAKLNNKSSQGVQ